MTIVYLFSLTDYYCMYFLLQLELIRSRKPRLLPLQSSKKITEKNADEVGEEPDTIEAIMANRCKRSCNSSDYRLLEHISPTSNLVERFAKLVFSEKRKSMLPIHLESVLYILHIR
jgi:hypothetical protein